MSCELRYCWHCLYLACHRDAGTRVLMSSQRRVKLWRWRIDNTTVDRYYRWWLVRTSSPASAQSKVPPPPSRPCWLLAVVILGPASTPHLHLPPGPAPCTFTSSCTAVTSADDDLSALGGRYETRSPLIKDPQKRTPQKDMEAMLYPTWQQLFYLLLTICGRDTILLNKTQTEAAPLLRPHWGLQRSKSARYIDCNI